MKDLKYNDICFVGQFCDVQSTPSLYSELIRWTQILNSRASSVGYQVVHLCRNEKIGPICEGHEI